jgi:hypothetical protein
MTIVWIAIGVAIGWVIPQPTLTWPDGTSSGQKVGLLAWVWLWVRDKAGMN